MESEYKNTKTQKIAFWIIRAMLLMWAIVSTIAIAFTKFPMVVANIILAAILWHFFIKSFNQWRAERKQDAQSGD